jgi:hypothetical protein
MRPHRPRLTRALKALAVVYVLALAAMPFAHHDLVCHLKSSTHCTTCHIGTSADSAGSDPIVTAGVLNDAGRPSEPIVTALSTPALLPSAGRSPPDTTL